MSRDAKLHEIQQLLSRVRQLESELAQEVAPANWPPPYYVVHHILAGMVFGAFAAAMSLLANIIGSMVIGQSPLQLIRIYLTFPLGEEAFRYGDNTVTLAIGVCLYLATGMLLGIPFQLILSKYFGRESFPTRFLVTTFMALIVWLINYYVILSWLQPLLIGGNWIVRDIPWWVAAATHLVFGWTILLAQPLGEFTPYRRTTETA